MAMVPSMPQRRPLMDAVLQNEDLLRIICGFLGKDPDRPVPTRELREFALVCRDISGVALDYLWRNISFDSIFFLFPEDLVCVGKKGRKSFLRPPSTLEHWSSFNIYASRIRSLEFYPPNMAPLADLAVHRPQLFPRLTSLQMSCWISQASITAVLFTPMLVDVSLSYHPPRRHKMTLDTEVAMFVAVLQTLEETCPSLQQFSFFHNSIWIPKSQGMPENLQNSLISLFRKCTSLVGVSVPTSPSVLEALGHLPSLCTLIMLPDRSKVPLVPVEDPLAFQALDVLHSFSVGNTLSSLTQLLKNKRCLPRKTIDVKYDDPAATTVDLVAFFQEVVHPHLHTFSLSFSGGETDIATSPGIQWQSFGPLFLLPHLRNLTITGLPVHITDQDLEEIPQLWPELDSLYLSPTIDGYPSQITFQGLDHLSNSPKLQSLSVMLNPQSDISSNMLSSRNLSTSPLNSINFHGCFPSVSVIELTLFLVSRFPQLETVKISGWDEDKCNEVERGLDLVRRALSMIASAV